MAVDAGRRDIGQRAELALDHRRGIGVKMRRDRHVPIGGDAQIIGHRDLETVAAVEPDFGHQYAAARLIVDRVAKAGKRSEEHTSELQSLMRISYAVFCLKKKKTNKTKSRP